MLILLNPTSGSGAESDEIEGWVSTREEAELRATFGAGDARRWAREAAFAGTEIVAAAGGDGTVREVALGILEAEDSETALGIVPMGTGNDLVRSLGVPLEIPEALALLERGTPRPMDVVRLTMDGHPDSFFLNAFTGGFSGALHDALDEEVKRTWGPLSYVRCGIETWGERCLYPIRIEIDGREGSYEVLNVAVANGTTAGSGIPVAPRADLFDGELDITLILDAPLLQLPGLAAHVLAGDMHDHEALVRTRGRVVRLSSGSPLPVSVDGEAFEASQFQLEVHATRLPVVVAASPVDGRDQSG